MSPEMHSGIISDPDKYRKGWSGGLPETPCGFGSRLSETAIQRQWLPKIVKKHRIRTVVDIGAGDLNWIEKVDWNVEYTPLDLVPRHPAVKEFDILREIPPQADMAMCLWVLNHMPETVAMDALDNILASQPKYLLYTWWPAMYPTLDLGYDERKVIRERIGAELRLIKC